MGVGIRDAKLVRYDEYIDRQIGTTRRLVKSVDVATVLVTSTCGVLGFLLVAAVADHWLVPGGFGTFTRLVLFAMLALGVTFYAIRRLWPLVMQPINPAYAAQTIEQSTPSLKNSLLNLLLFRQRRAEIADAVYETLEEQAAQRLTRVPVEASVDRTVLIRFGYVLVAVVAVCALYKMLSPKDPFVTVQRVLKPWADIVPASRVAITDVAPGTITLARGELLEISADVRGIGEDDPVFVRYTTADGQAVDKSVQLTPSTAGLRYSGRIPAGEAGEIIGVAQNLRYRIEAGDGRSPEYAVTVVAAPTITILRIDYDYQPYTGFMDRSIDALGDIRAIEGTKVTIHSRANGSIEAAWVDFEADGRRDIDMNVVDREARTSFVLMLRDDRQTPQHTSYALRFTGVDGRANRDPVKFSIDVVPDQAPEIAVVAPQERARDVRLDESVAIDVEARDPDFALGGVRLRGEVAGREAFDESLLTADHTGRFTGRFQFSPSKHDLKPGDVVRYWAVATDVRTPEPNKTASKPRTFRIVSPDPNADRHPPPDRIAQRDQRRPGEQQQDQQRPGEQPENSQQGGEQQPGGGEGQQGQPADGSEGTSGGESGDSEQSSNEQTQGGERQDGREQSGGEQNRDGAQNQSGDGADGEQRRDQQESREQDGRQTGQGNSRGQSEGAEGARDRRRPGTGQQNSGNENSRENDNRGGEQTPNRERQPGEGREEQQSPVSPEGDNDGEAFERIRRFMNQNGKSSDSAARDSEPNESRRGEEKNREESANPDTSNARRDDSGKGPGAETKTGESNNETPDRGARQDNSQSPGGQETGSKGPAGSGEQPEREQGSPDSQPDRKPSEKWQQRPNDQQSNDDAEPPAGGRGKKESDSQGDQGGDRAGGGEEGGGQRANREGTGSAGQNQSADEGGGESSEQGEGHNSPNAGQDAPADDRTGASGDQPGRGSAERDGQGEQAGGGEAGGDATDRDNNKSESEGSEESSNQGDPLDQSSQQQGEEEPNDRGQKRENGFGGSATPGAGRTPDAAIQPNRTDSTAPEGDAANLEYARRQTDLVLETLEEQLKRKDVDKRLLDELGWTAEDLQRFIDRWQGLKAAAREDTPTAGAARRELDDALRSLGLRRGPLQQDNRQDDQLRDLHEGYRGTVPLEYRERLRAYSESISRARPEDE